MKTPTAPQVILELIGTAMKETGAESENALAVRLGMDRQKLNNYKFGTKPTNENISILCEAAKKDFNTTLLAIERAFAKTEDAKKRWENHMKRLGGFAASIALAFIVLVTGIVTPSPAEAAPLRQVSPTTLCIM